MLTIGVECGGSDTTSGLASNPCIGYVADRFVAEGGRIVISETSEFLGAEELFAERALDDGVRKAFLRKVIDHEQEAIKRGVDIRGTNRSEEHTSELQSLMRISYAVFCLKK